jgi:hypothetical protein
VILYDLICNKDHEFEVWFRDAAACEEQLATGAVPCPTCGSSMVDKALMAPNVSKAKAPAEVKLPQLSTKAAMETAEAGKVRRALAELRDKIEKDFDHVGPQFAEEARKIHYGESDAHNIYGETSDQEAKELHDEGVAFTRIPWAPRQDS